MQADEIHDVMMDHGEIGQAIGSPSARAPTCGKVVKEL
jgi:hypothetical protein